MKRMLLILALLCTSYAQSQEKTFEKEVKKISDAIDAITKQEKDSLKQKVETINYQLEKEKINTTEAEQLKKEAAQYHANNIENRVGVEELKLQQLVQDKTNGKIASSSESEGFNIEVFNTKIINFESKKKKKYKNYKTTSQFVFALGTNNVLVNNKLGSLNNSNYKFWQSHFYEVGFTFKTRLTEAPSKAYIKYGLSFLWNNLRAENNQYHVLNANQTNLATFSETLLESRFRHVQMIFPTHLEFDFSKSKKYKNGFIRDATHRSLRLGVGGFFGFKIGTRQYLEFKNSNGVKVEEVQKNGFNTNVLTYGLSGFLAYRDIGLYAKYDLNPLFKNTETRNISLGVRFDL